MTTSLRAENERLRQSVARLELERDHVANANVHAALQMAAISEKRQSELEEQSAQLRTALNQAKSAAKKKDEFLANVSHELRTPLNGIIGMGTLLVDAAEDALQQEYATTALDSARSLLAIINDLLDFSKMQVERLKLCDEEYDLWKLIGGVTRLLPRPNGSSTSPGSEPSVQLESYVCPNLPRLVRGNPARLRQILINLCGNALKFTERGSVHIEALPVRAASGEELRVRLSVTDTGCGIAPESLDDIFESFRQIDNTSTRQHGGTGLGLAISKRLVEMMGGQIIVESELGVGSTFAIELPLNCVEPDPAPPAVDVLPGVVYDVRDTATRRTLVAHLDKLGVKHARASELESLSWRPHIAFLEVQGENDERSAQLQVTADLLQKSDCEVVWTLPFACANIENQHALRTLAMPLCAHELTALLGNLGEVCLERTRAALPAESNTTYLELLVVEDNPVNQLVAKRLLERLGHRVTSASSALVGLQLLESKHFDAVLMDCHMPGMDGYEATQRIRERERKEGGAPMRIIALTANAMPSDRERCLAAGMDDYVSKPIDTMALLRALERARSHSTVANVEADPGRELDAE